MLLGIRSKPYLAARSTRESGVFSSHTVLSMGAFILDAAVTTVLWPKGFTGGGSGPVGIGRL